VHVVSAQTLQAGSDSIHGATSAAGIDIGASHADSVIVVRSVEAREGKSRVEAALPVYVDCCTIMAHSS